MGRRLRQDHRRKVNYQSIGSGGGIKQIKAKTVDFGASDAPLKPRRAGQGRPAQFPTVIGGVVPVVNVAGVAPGALKLTGPLLADIFLGKITKWNDPAIAALNTGVSCPTKHHRRAPRRRLGHHLHLHQLPVEGQPRLESQGRRRHRGEVADRRGRQGQRRRAAYVQRLPSSIGYVEYAYAMQNKMTHAQLKNKAGTFVAPDDASFQAAAAGADWNKTFYQVLTDQPGKDAWPITGATFILMHKVQDKPAQAAAVLKFFDWAYKEGDKMAADLDYVTLPDNVKALVRKQWGEIKDAGGKLAIRQQVIARCQPSHTSRAAQPPWPLHCLPLRSRAGGRCRAPNPRRARRRERLAALGPIAVFAAARARRGPADAGAAGWHHRVARRRRCAGDPRVRPVVPGALGVGSGAEPATAVW